MQHFDFLTVSDGGKSKVLKVELYGGCDRMGDCRHNRLFFRIFDFPETIHVMYERSTDKVFEIVREKQIKFLDEANKFYADVIKQFIDKHQV